MARTKGKTTEKFAGLVISNKKSVGKRVPLGKIQLVTTPFEYAEEFINKALAQFEKEDAGSIRGTLTVYK